MKSRKRVFEVNSVSINSRSGSAQLIVNSSSSPQRLERKSLRHETSTDATPLSSRTEQAGVGVLEMFDTSMKDYATFRDACSDPDIDVYYINGINTNPGAHGDSVTELTARLNYLKLYFKLRVSVYGIYNPTDGMVVDLLECIGLVAQQTFNIGASLVIDIYTRHTNLVKQLLTSRFLRIVCRQFAFCLNWK